MEKKEIIIFTAVMIFVAIRLYQKYSKKGKNNTAGNTGSSSGSELLTSSKDDDYEPYSKK